MRKLVYLALDAHVSHCVLGGMDMRGKLLFCDRFPTSESALICHIAAVKARRRLLVLEESPLAGWLAGTLRPYVGEIIVCDPRQSASSVAMPTRMMTVMSIRMFPPKLGRYRVFCRYLSRRK